jgi:hypothetical protein
LYEQKEKNPPKKYLKKKKYFWVKILKFFDADSGWKKFGSGILDGTVRIRDPGETSRIRNTRCKIKRCTCSL